MALVAVFVTQSMELVPAAVLVSASKMEPVPLVPLTHGQLVIQLVKIVLAASHVITPMETALPAMPDNNL